jgi:hypothetical protein
MKKGGASRHRPDSRSGCPKSGTQASVSFKLDPGLGRDDFGQAEIT